MKYSAFLLILLAIGCGSAVVQRAPTTEKVVEAPEVAVEAVEVFYQRQSGLWKFKVDSGLVSGKITSYHPDGKIAKVVPVVNGSKEGTQLTYFPDGKAKFEEHFSDNQLNGVVKRWGLGEGYQLLAELNYVDGKLHGTQKKWYATGELHKVLQLRDGKEEGLQQAFRKNGALYANYEARNGRVFGLKRSNLCYELEKEQVVYLQ